MTDERNRLRQWLRTALERHPHETPTSLARSAGLAGSTVTRFLSDDDAPVLSSRTRAKLEHAIAALDRQARGGMADAGQLTPAATDDTRVSEALAALRGERASVIALQCPATHDLDAFAISAGDWLIVDEAAAPRPGDLAVAQHYDWQTGGARTVYRLYDPPYLISGNPRDPQARKPLLVDNDTVVLRGRVLFMLREM